MLWALALAGCAAAGVSFAVAFASDHVADALVDAALLDWIVLPYILAGVVAWWRRPESRFGPLMVAAGFGMFLSSLQWANWALPYTIGLAFDLLPAVLFLHVFLAFPRGNLETAAERIVVGVAYFAAVGLQLVKMLLGGYVPDNLLGVFSNLAAANTVEDVQLFMLAGASLAGIPLLFIRRRASGRPLRHWVEVLVYSFAVGLVMVAVLLIAGSFGWPSFQTIRRITFITIGLSPIAFLIGLLSARLARSTVTDLLVELHADPAPADLPKLFACAARSVAHARLLAAAVRELGRPRWPAGHAPRRPRGHDDRARRPALGSPGARPLARGRTRAARRGQRRGRHRARERPSPGRAARAPRGAARLA
jgi:hypothetical protein